MTSVGILGAGCWGITLGMLLLKKGYTVSLWEPLPKKAKILSQVRTLQFLPHIKIPAKVTITGDIEEAVKDKNIIVFAVPSYFVRESAKKVSKIITEGVSIISAGKGLENGTYKRMSEVIAEEIPHIKKSIYVLSGPSHAEEVLQEIPTAVVLAGTDKEKISEIQKIFFTDCFRVYTQDDVAGVEFGGALKNIFAIACGISDGLGLGVNTKAALVTRGLRELAKLGVALGGKLQTFFGLSGLGDLVVTCFSSYSRNRNFGEKIGQGKSIATAMKEIGMVIEGIKTTKAAYMLGRRNKLALPIIEETYSVLYLNKKPKEAIPALMLREPKPEIDSIM